MASEAKREARLKTQDARCKLRSKERRGPLTGRSIEHSIYMHECKRRKIAEFLASEQMQVQLNWTCQAQGELNYGWKWGIIKGVVAEVQCFLC